MWEDYFPITNQAVVRYRDGSSLLVNDLPKPIPPRKIGKQITPFHMPKIACRLRLFVTKVSEVELGDINEDGIVGPEIINTPGDKIKVWLVDFNKVVPVEI